MLFLFFKAPTCYANRKAVAYAAVVITKEIKNGASTIYERIIAALVKVEVFPNGAASYTRVLEPGHEITSQSSRLSHAKALIDEELGQLTSYNGPISKVEVGSSGIDGALALAKAKATTKANEAMAAARAAARQ